MLDNKDEYFIKAVTVSQKFSGEFSKNNLTAKLKILLNIFVNTSKSVVFSLELATSSKIFTFQACKHFIRLAVKGAACTQKVIPQFFNLSQQGLSRMLLWPKVWSSTSWRTWKALQLPKQARCGSIWPSRIFQLKFFRSYSKKLDQPFDKKIILIDSVQRSKNGQKAKFDKKWPKMSTDGMKNI